ncbi:MAG: hypothetical protein ACOC00_00255 [Halothiobacillaceae bacterium]
MKIKEYWPSLRRAWQLQRVAPARLQAQAAGAESLPVLVSLTSIPERLPRLHLTVRSLLAQERPPEGIVLWLNEDDRMQVPDKLQCLQGAHFQIRFGRLHCPHRKLIFALEAFPDRTIVTCDDDVMYARDWLDRLYVSHQAFPGEIVAHECRRIRRASDGVLLPYRDWTTVEETGVSEPQMMSVGYGGVLYPPGSLHPDVLDVERFMQLAPYADDLWFKAMAYRQGTAIRRSVKPRPKPVPIVGTQSVSLRRHNVRADGNRQQWQALAGHFGIDI